MSMNQIPRMVVGPPVVGPASPVGGALYDSATSPQQLDALLQPLRYADKQRVARDVMGLIKNSNSLAFKVAAFVGPNGASEPLLQLLGTTPIYYKGACYNIPVSIWVVQHYPHRPPSCFVTPTKDMRIKDGHLHVDHFGMIYLPYLNQWNAQTSNLLEMVTMMSSVFSTDPPVFKVPSNAPPQQQPPMQQQPEIEQWEQIPDELMQQAVKSPVNAAAQPPAAAAAYSSNPYYAQRPGQPAPAVQPSHAAAAVSVQDPRAARKNQLIQSLTSQLRKQLEDDLSLKTLLMDDLLAHQQQLDSHSRSIEDKLSSLRSDAAQLEAANIAMSAKNEEMSRWLDANEKREMVDVDRVCYVKDTWSKQLMENVSLDLALEDAYYLLDRALAEGNIDLQSYTKQLRSLSRKQFYARALIAQIQQHQQAAAAGPPQQQQQLNGSGYYGQ